MATSSTRLADPASGEHQPRTRLQMSSISRSSHLADGSSIGAALDDETETFHRPSNQMDDESGPRRFCENDKPRMSRTTDLAGHAAAAALDSAGDISQLREQDSGRTQKPDHGPPTG